VLDRLRPVPRGALDGGADPGDLRHPPAGGRRGMTRAHMRPFVTKESARCCQRLASVCDRRGCLVGPRGRPGSARLLSPDRSRWAPSRLATSIPTARSRFSCPSRRAGDGF
jgi:hypothetical protein